MDVFASRKYEAYAVACSGRRTHEPAESAACIPSLQKSGFDLALAGAGGVASVGGRLEVQAVKAACTPEDLRLSISGTRLASHTRERRGGCRRSAASHHCGGHAASGAFVKMRELIV